MIPAISVPSAASSGSLLPIRRLLTTIAGSQDEDEYEEDEEEYEEEYEESGQIGYVRDNNEENVNDDEKLIQRDLNIDTFKLYSDNLVREYHVPKLIEKSVIIHKDENGFGLRIGGHFPVFIEHVHENSAAWRAGVRCSDRISKINGVLINGLNHTEVVLMFKNSSRFVGLTLLTAAPELEKEADIIHDGHQKLHNPSTNLQISVSIEGSNHYSLKQSQNGLIEDNYNPMSVRYPYNSHTRSASGSFSIHPKDTPNVLYETSRSAVPHEINSKNRIARRSESVLGFRTNHLLTDKHLTASSQTSNSSSSGNSYVWFQRNSRLPYSTATCESCLAPIARSSSSASSTEHQLLKCLQCQLNHLSKEVNLKSTSQNLQRPTYGSLRDPPKQQPHRVEIRVSSQESKQIEERVESATSYMKLSRSINNISSATAFSPRQQTLNIRPAVEGSTCIKIADNINGNVTTTQPASVLVKRPPVTNKRLEIIKEFIDTEKTHTERLRCMDELFYRPLKQGAYMTAEQLRMVFSCHKTLYKIHRQIHRTLLSASYNLCEEPMIGSALLEIFEGELKRRLEKAACTFCAAQSTNVELLNKLTKRDTKVGDFIAQVSSQQMVGRLGVKDLLASCFQRLTKYPLLLENLLKATPKDIPILSGEGVENKATKGGGGGDDKLANKRAEREETRGMKGPENNIITTGFAGSIEQENCERAAAAVDAETTRTSRRMLAIGLAEEREFIERALYQSKQILFKVNESVKVATSNSKLKEIWRKTDKYPGVPLVDISKQQVVHEGQLTLRLSKRSFDVYVLLLTDYLIILSREGQDKYRLKFFTPDGKSSSSSSSSGNAQALVYSPVFIIDEHLSTRDAATDENGFYLLCKRKDDSRIYEFASRSPAERLKWRDRIQSAIEGQMSRTSRRPSCESTTTKSSSEISSRLDMTDETSVTLTTSAGQTRAPSLVNPNNNQAINESSTSNNSLVDKNLLVEEDKLSKIEGTISYVEDDGIVMPYKLESSQIFANQAIQVTLVEPPVQAH